MKTKEKIKEYFKNAKLEVLDKETSKGVWGAFGNEKVYGAVSLTYLHKYLLKERVSLKFVAKTIAELCKEQYLLPIPCSFAKDLVFCQYEWSLTKHWMKFHFHNNEVISSEYYKDSHIGNQVKIFNNLIK